MKLKKLGFGGRTLKLIQSLYYNDNIKFVINGKYTDPIWLTLGVKQGNDSENCGGITLLFTFQVATYPHSFLVFSLIA